MNMKKYKIMGKEKISKYEILNKYDTYYKSNPKPCISKKPSDVWVSFKEVCEFCSVAEFKKLDRLYVDEISKLCKIEDVVHSTGGSILLYISSVIDEKVIDNREELEVELSSVIKDFENQVNIHAKEKARQCNDLKTTLLDRLNNSSDRHISFYVMKNDNIIKNEFCENEYIDFGYEEWDLLGDFIYIRDLKLLITEYYTDIKIINGKKTRMLVIKKSIKL